MAYAMSYPFMRFEGESHEMHRSWAFYLAIGVALLLLGAIAIIYTLAATLVTAALFGWLLAIGGLVLIAHAFWTRSWTGLFLHLLLGILYFVVGILLAVHPLAAAVSLTLLLAAFFMGSGLFRLIGAAMVRFPSWGWVAFGGAVSFVLGLLIWAQWPESSFWAIGLLVGIDLLFHGWSLVMLSMVVRGISPGMTGRGRPAMG